MDTYYDGHKIMCGHCEETRETVGYQLGMVILWRNQHGSKIRVLCRLCGCTTDMTRTHDKFTSKVRPPWKWGMPDSNPIGWTAKEIAHGQ